MRELTTADLLRRFMSELGRIVNGTASVYLVGGATAVLLGWRETTIDVDIRLDPETEQLMRSVVEIKDRLDVNVEFASPDQFIPELPGWRERSPFIERVGDVSFFHYDPYAQTLAKIERGHDQDVADVREMFAHGLVERGRLLELFEQISPELYRFPAIDPSAFREAVEAALRQAET